MGCKILPTTSRLGASVHDTSVYVSFIYPLSGSPSAPNATLVRLPAGGLSGRGFPERHRHGIPPLTHLGNCAAGFPVPVPMAGRGGYWARRAATIAGRIGVEDAGQCSFQAFTPLSSPLGVVIFCASRPNWASSMRSSPSVVERLASCSCSSTVFPAQDSPAADRDKPFQGHLAGSR